MGNVILFLRKCSVALNYQMNRNANIALHHHHHVINSMRGRAMF